METVPQKYMDQAISGCNTYTPGMLPVQRYQLTRSQIELLVHELNDSWTGLSCRGAMPHFEIYDNANVLWAKMTVRSGLIEVDSSPAQHTDRPYVSEAVFWQRFWNCMYMRFAPLRA